MPVKPQVREQIIQTDPVDEEVIANADTQAAPIVPWGWPFMSSSACVFERGGGGGRIGWWGRVCVCVCVCVRVFVYVCVWVCA